MEELSIEEKAKRYDEAIKRAKEWYNDNQIGIGFKANLEKLFSELKESEDEKIRKRLITLVNDTFDDNNFGYLTEREDYKKMIAYLEKQGEKDKEITLLKDKIESLRAANIAIKETHKIELERQAEQKKYPQSVIDNAVSFLSLRNDGMPIEDAKDIVNALLTVLNPECWSKQGEQKPAEWSEEDVEMFGNVLSTLSICSNNPDIPIDVRKMHQKEYAWFEELYNRVQPQPKQEWSEKDEQFKIERKAILNDVIAHLKFLASIEKNKVSSSYIQRDIDWIKENLPFLRPQKQWKPSEEQMVALKCAITTADEKWVCMNTKDLESLYKDLKKLKAL